MKNLVVAGISKDDVRIVEIAQGYVILFFDKRKYGVTPTGAEKWRQEMASEMDGMVNIGLRKLDVGAMTIMSNPTMDKKGQYLQDTISRAVAFLDGSIRTKKAAFRI